MATTDDLVTALNAHIAAYFAAHYPKSTIPIVEVQQGQKYARLVAAEHYPGGQVNRSAIGFVNLATGDVLKAAGWKAPAKGVRGNLADIPAVLRRCSPHGAVS